MHMCIGMISIVEMWINQSIHLVTAALLRLVGHFIVQLSSYASQHMAIDRSSSAHAKVTLSSTNYPCR
jgi:hypothetical protein